MHINIYKIISFILFILSCFLLLGIIIIKDYIKHTDISLYPVKKLHNSNKNEKTWLISYASGDPYIQSQNNLNMSASMTQAFDVFINYQPHHIDKKYYEKHKNILDLKRGVGYWLWKPYIILETLKMMPEGDILLYLDRSSILRDGIYQVLELARHHDITLFPGFHSNRRYMKKIVIDKILNGDESIRDKVQLEAGFILLKNNQKTRDFIQEWLNYCEDYSLLTDAPIVNEYPDFVDHRHDQAILTALYYKNPEKYNLYSSYLDRREAFFVTRRSDIKFSLLSLTFNKELGNIKWNDHNKFLLKLKNWMIGSQNKPEPICSLDESAPYSKPVCID